MIFPLLRTWFKPLWPSALRSSRKVYKTPSGFRTIGGGYGGSHSRDRRTGGPPSANPITANMTFTESEERIMKDVKLQSIKGSSKSSSSQHHSTGIVVSNEIEVTMEDRHSQVGAQGPQRAHEAW